MYVYMYVNGYEVATYVEKGEELEKDGGRGAFVLFLRCDGCIAMLGVGCWAFGW